jgi:hypothetical protein
VKPAASIYSLVFYGEMSSECQSFKEEYMRKQLPGGQGGTKAWVELVTVFEGAMWLWQGK